MTRHEHASPGGIRYDVGDSLEDEGRTLRVKLLEETDYTSTDQRLICVPE